MRILTEVAAMIAWENSIWRFKTILWPWKLIPEKRKKLKIDLFVIV